MAKPELERTLQFIREKNCFLVLSHLRPDGDAMGSTLGMVGMLKALGKHYVAANPDPVPRKFQVLPWAGEVISYERISFSDLAPIRYVLTVDCADKERLHLFPQHFAQGVEIVNIDHHPTNTMFGSVNYVRPEAAATAQILCELAEKLSEQKKVLNRELAICLYTGLMTDTGGFRYSNTTPEVMEMASRLLAYGVNPAKLADRFLETMTFSHIKLLQKALARLHIEEAGKLAWFYVTSQDLEEVQADSEDVDGLVQYAIRIEGVEVGVCFKETNPGKVKISLRSKEQVDVAQIAQGFGGGGHVRAAGCTVEGTLQAAFEQVLAQVRGRLNGPNRAD